MLLRLVLKVPQVPVSENHISVMSLRTLIQLDVCILTLCKGWIRMVPFSPIGEYIRHSLQIDPSGASPFLNHNFS